MFVVCDSLSKIHKKFLVLQTQNERMVIPHDIVTLLMFSVNLSLIVTNIYGWLLKRFFVPDAYKNNVLELYPAQRSVAQFYLLQLFEIPYLLMIGQPEALFYVNGTALLVFSSFILVMVKRYFYLQTNTFRHRLFFLLPMWACWVALLMPLFDIIPFSDKYQWIMTGVVLVVFAVYMFKLDQFRKQLNKRIRESDEDEYSNEEDFPVKFARSVKWLPLTLCLILLVNFLMNNALVKMMRDFIFIIINVWFVIYTLNPHRRIKTFHIEMQMDEHKETEEQEEVPMRHYLTEDQRKSLETNMLNLVKGEKFYLESHFTMSDLVKQMNTNKAYLSEVISNSEYGSFYQLINTLRIEHAIWMLSEDPNLKMEQVALASGFSSGSAFSQVFKRIKGMSPSEYLHQ